MVLNSALADSCVLVTGGTQGLGKAIGMAFSRAGAMVVLTYKWGTVPPERVQLEFVQAGLLPPHILQADVAERSDMRAVMAYIKQLGKTLKVLVSNVAVAKVIHDLNEYKPETLALSLKYSAWPVVDLTQMVNEIFGHYPRYVIAVSSDGSEVCHPGYDFVGVAKAAQETLCRYLAVRLRPHGVNVNVLRSGLIDTASLRQTLGPECVEQVKAKAGPLLLDATVVANACLALCSGYLDGMTGQIITIDGGWSLISPISFLTGIDGPETA